MDKLLPAIDWLKKNRFWVGCSILSLAMIGTWFWTTGQIAEQTNKNASDVKSQIQAADNIMKVSAEEGAAAHPNSYTEEGMAAELSKALDEIVAAWELRYNAQKQFLKWPVEVIGDDKFVSVFSQFEPAEKFPDNFDRGLGLERYLELYRITIPKQMVKICKELGTNWKYDPETAADQIASTAGSGFGDDDDDEGDDEGMGSRSGMGGFGGMGGGMRGGAGAGPGGSAMTTVMEDLNKYAVIWNDDNQAMWNRKLTDFMGKDNHTLSVPAPTPLQVYALQQDLWLLEAMFRVIKSVNGTANANDLASIKEIEHVAFGREARTQLGELTPFDPRLAGIELVAETDAEIGEAPDMDYEDDEGEEEDDDGFNKLSYKPYHGRYVNPNYEPLHADTVRDVLRGTDMPTENLELIVAKRVPFRIALKMDERKIPEFLAACANSPFSFEINQIRLNRHVANEGIVFNGGGYGEDNEAQAAGNSRAGMSDAMGSFDMGGGFRGNERGDATATVASTDVEIRTNYDVRVEFYGIVKIYNPVREKFLRKAAGADDNPDPNDVASDRVPPAATSKP